MTRLTFPLLYKCHLDIHVLQEPTGFGFREHLKSWLPGSLQKQRSMFTRNRKHEIGANSYLPTYEEKISGATVMAFRTGTELETFFAGWSAPL